MKFSERFGFKHVNKTIQIDTMSDELRISLWNIVYQLYLKQEQQYRSEKDYLSIHPDEITTLMWVNLWKKEIDKKVEAHGGQSKAQRSEMLKQTKVDAKTLKDNASKKAPVEKEQVETKQASKDEGHEIGE